jgi:hypothetical protein
MDDAGHAPAPTNQYLRGLRLTGFYNLDAYSRTANEDVASS